jgi:hypothetical protein
MDFPSLTLTDLQPWFNKSDMIKACAEQTIKDLGLYGIKLHFSGNTSEAYQELFQQIKPAISERLQSGQSLQEILYRVDVNEKQVQAFMNSDNDIASGLTTLILWRELQKVVTRFLLSASQTPPDLNDAERL